MTGSQAPATAVIVARVRAGTPPTSLAEAIPQAGPSAASVTWALDPDTFVAAGDAVDLRSCAVTIDAAASASRAELRRRLALAGADGARPTAAVFAPGTPCLHRDLLVGAGLGVVMVDRLEGGSRGARRPAPEGWRCRSTLWGLWEVEATGTPSAGGLTRLLPWSGRPAPGSLTVIALDSSGDPRADARRVAATIERLGRSVAVVPLAALAETLGRMTAPSAASVLRAA